MNPNKFEDYSFNNREADDIIVKYNRMGPSTEKELSCTTQPTQSHAIPGTKLDPSFLNLFAK